MRRENGITLIALIITIIILVILAAVSINAVYNMGIVGHAINGTQEYAQAAKDENEMLGKTTNRIEDAVAKVKEIQNGSGKDTGEETQTEDEHVTTVHLMDTSFEITIDENETLESFKDKVEDPPVPFPYQEGVSYYFYVDEAKTQKIQQDLSYNNYPKNLYVKEQANNEETLKLIW